MEILNKIHDKLDLVSQTDYVKRIEIINEYWEELEKIEEVSDINMFVSYTLIGSYLGLALRETGDIKRALEVTNIVIKMYDKYKNKLEIDFEKDLIYHHLLFNKVVCLFRLGRIKESNNLLNRLCKLKPDDESYKIWKKRVNIEKLYYIVNTLNVIGLVLMALDCFLLYVYDIQTYFLYIIIGWGLIGLGIILKKVANNKKKKLE